MVGLKVTALLLVTSCSLLVTYPDYISSRFRRNVVKYQATPQKTAVLNAGFLKVCIRYDDWCVKGTLRPGATLHGLRLAPVILKDSARNTQSTHSVSVIKSNRLMLQNEIITVCSEIHIKHTNTLCEQDAELLNVEHSGT